MSKKNHRSITISKDNYDKLVELGDMTRTFDSVLSEVMIKANINVKSSAAAAKENDD